MDKAAIPMNMLMLGATLAEGVKTIPVDFRSEFSFGELFFFDVFVYLFALFAHG